MPLYTNHDSENEYYLSNAEEPMDAASHSKTDKAKIDWRLIIGLVLIVSGGLVLAEQVLRIGVFQLLAPLVAGVILLWAGVRDRRSGFLISGSIVFGTGLGVFIGITKISVGDSTLRFGVGLTGLAVGFLMITPVVYVILRRVALWPLIPGIMIGSIAMVFLFTQTGILDFVLYIVTSLGLIFLFAGLNKKLIGLIIPGCLLMGIGPGVALSWGRSPGLSPLAQTGVMLVWFALGWGLITLFTRIVLIKFVWWPLIPGGILAMVGWGLYIGGNPDNAVGFIRNTGSIVMIIFGTYLLLMRRGIRR
jgi:hypothetical protein